jgi:hypothetical protein
MNLANFEMSLLAMSSIAAAILLSILAIRLMRHFTRQRRDKNAPTEKPETTEKPRENFFDEDFLLETEEGWEILRELSLSEAEVKKSLANINALHKSLEEAELEERVYQALRRAAEAEKKIILAKEKLRLVRINHPSKWKIFWRNRKEDVKRYYHELGEGGRRFSQNFGKCIRGSRYLVTGGATVAVIILLFKLI